MHPDLRDIHDCFSRQPLKQQYSGPKLRTVYAAAAPTDWIDQLEQTNDNMLLVDNQNACLHSKDRERERERKGLECTHRRMNAIHWKQPNEMRVGNKLCHGQRATCHVSDEPTFRVSHKLERTVTVHAKGKVEIATFFSRKSNQGRFDNLDKYRTAVYYAMSMRIRVLQ